MKVGTSQTRRLNGPKAGLDMAAKRKIYEPAATRIPVTKPVPKSLY